MMSFLRIAALFVLLTANGAGFAASPVDEEVVRNGDFELDADGDDWPDGWARPVGGGWQQAGDNRFLRLETSSPGKTVMLYQELPLPQGSQALELKWRQRVSGLKVGLQAWYDARIMLEFLNAKREKVSPNPPAAATRKDTDGWVEKSAKFLVPADATTLKFMPSLFQVEAGTFDLDDVSLQVIDAGPLREAERIAAEKRLAQLKADAEKRRSKAEKLLASEGSLLTNGDFEGDVKKQDSWPDDWGRPKSGDWVQEDGNRFVRIISPAPGETVMVYRAVDIPAGVKALELSWRQRVTGLKKGAAPWFDARIMLELRGVDGRKLAQPSPPNTQKDTDGWVEKSTRFLVPEEALSVVLMPALFEVQSGTLDLDDFVLKPTSPEPLLAAARLREEEARLRFVPPEKPDRTKWPSELKVVGNRLHDSEGREVWLQGVNAGGLETLPQDKQVLKSVVVAIDDWGANCVRLPMSDTFWYGKSPYQKDGGAEYRATIDRAIVLAANRGAYLVVDLHRFRAPTKEHADFWRDFAAIYKNHPAVLFDVFNEPHGISWEVWRNGGLVGEREGVDESAFLTDEDKRKNQGFQSVGMQGLVDAVRSTGAKNIVVAGGIFWCNDLTGIVNGYALDDKTGNGVMYSWHTYNWHKGWEKLLPTAAKHPILVGELGADIHKMDFIPAADQEDPYTWVPDMLGFIQEHRLNWTGWCLHPKATPIMISDWLYTPTPFWGQFAKDALEGKQFDMKKVR